MNVAVTLWYVIQCPECCAEVERISSAACRDFTVTRLTLAPGHRHNHPLPEGEVSALAPGRGRGRSAPPTTPHPPPPSGQLFTASASAPTDALPNGFDHSG